MRKQRGRLWDEERDAGGISPFLRSTSFLIGLVNKEGGGVGGWRDGEALIGSDFRGGRCVRLRPHLQHLPQGLLRQ